MPTPGGCIRQLLFLVAMVVAGFCSPVTAGESGRYVTVGPKETLAILARRYGVSAGTIASANHLPSTARLTPGARLFIPGARNPAPKPPPPAKNTSPSSSPLGAASDVYLVKQGDSLLSLSRRLRIPVDQLAGYNNLSRNAALTSGQKLKIPKSAGATKPAKPQQPARKATADPATSAGPPPADVPAADSSPAVVSKRPAVASRRGFIWPVEGRLSRTFADNSRAKFPGIDIAAKPGTPVCAARAGTILYADDRIAAYGNMVIIQHNGDLATCYGFLASPRVRLNQRVDQGDVIGEVSANARGSQPHLHFQLRHNGDSIDPMPYLP